MAQVLVVDDDPLTLKIASTILGRVGHEVVTATNGREALQAVRAERPDIIVTDVMMPEIDGYDMTRRLRRDPESARIPILVLTAQSELEDKLNAFEAGADDYMSKPFEPAELTARLAKLLRWHDALRTAHAPEETLPDKACLIAVHSLRGGIGCSSLAVNLAMGLQGLWRSPTLLIDMVLVAGQVALMLDAPLKRTWADLSGYDLQDLDLEMIQTVIGQHESGLDFLAAPTLPEEAEGIPVETVKTVLGLLAPRYAYIVADLPHDFGSNSIQGLDMADKIVLLLAPEMSSVRAAAAALETYNKLGYDPEKIVLVLNWTFQQHGLARKAIEDVLHSRVALVIPFAPERFVQSINLGRPLLHSQPEDPVAALLEDFAFRLSKEQHLLIPPAVPSPGWQRVSQRLAASAAKRK